LPEATDEELASAATKIGAVFRGKKAREEVAQMKATTDAEGTKPVEAVPEEAPKEGAPVEENPA